MTTPTPPRTSPLARLADWVTRETTSGILLLVAALLALAWANSPWHEAFASISGFTFGPEALHLNLSVAAWASDGLLAIFFFVVGVELKHEIVDGSLSNPREAAVPVFAAVGGMAVPAIVFVAIVSAFGDTSALAGWAIPVATDIAFAVAVLAIFGRGLPRALRTFLLTLAVVDDLLAIIVIAIFYTATITLWALAAALAAVALFAIVVRSRRPHWWLLVPLALIAWGFMHASGVHATIAGVLLGFTVPARVIHGEVEARTHRFSAKLGPISSGIALPLFAFFAAGVTLVGGEGVGAVLGQPIVLAVMVALVAGKFIGVLGATAILTRFTRLRLPDAIGMRDLVPVGLLTGIGFTVSLLITELSFPDHAHTDGAKVAVLLASLTAAVLAAIMLRWDARKARSSDMNEDGIPDVNIERYGD